MSHSYRDLLVWQKSILLVKEIYRATQRFPRSESYALSDQLRRAAVSVPSNIFEGQGQFSTNESRQFLAPARGSMHEIETQPVIAKNFGYLGEEDLESLTRASSEVSRMLNGLIDSIAPGRSIARPVKLETGNWKLETRK